MKRLLAHLHGVTKITVAVWIVLTFIYLAGVMGIVFSK